MTVYAINKLLYLLENDAAFRQRIKTNSDDALTDFRLSPSERESLVRGDILALFEMGVHPFLLNGLSRHELFGVDRANYTPRIRGEAKAGQDNP